ncbi:alpha/beta fold hydrolase (plasmid) [Paraburkholderia sp. PREW-6R]|uniref:alpha/beta fold hydrolase n=1 Tax=Paraburkholderia sp. PREW-6R TaxID=3141544 RepID=UPI0031F538AB
MLRAKGHLVTAVDLPARWARPEVAAATTPADFVESVGQVVRASPLPVVLVGHSLGGATISMVAEAYPDKVARLVYVTAFLVPPGETVRYISMSDKASLIPSSIRRDASTRTTTVIPEKAKDVFYADCSDDDVRIALQLLCAEPSTMGEARMLLSEERFGRVERVYVECLQDRAISIGTQRAMHAKLPCRKVFTLDSSHSPFLSNAEQLSDILGSLACTGFGCVNTL